MTTSNFQKPGLNQLYWVADNIIASGFPPVTKALRDPDGLLAIGGNLSSETLLDAYRRGIFPWYSKGQPILWWSPNPRCVLEVEDLKISRSLHKTIRRNIFTVTFNREFDQVIKSCAEPREEFADTWITDDMDIAYNRLHNDGYAISVETWYGNELVGGLYGLVIGKVFFGESMFSRMTDASKVALVILAEELKRREFRIIDCQVHSRHLQSLGARPMPRDLFVNLLQHYCNQADNLPWPQTQTQASA